MNYYLYLVETKKEYTIHLVNALTPLIYEGIASIYNFAKEASPHGDDILIIFQKLLRQIASWNDLIIERETNRILSSIKINNGTIIDDLIKAVIKANIMVLSNTPPEKKNSVNIEHNITTQKFIHCSYLVTARNIYQHPDLFDHTLNDLELKKNQRDTINIIKTSIEDAIRQLLPMKMILETYLDSNIEQVGQIEQIEHHSANKMYKLVNIEKPKQQQPEEPKQPQYEETEKEETEKEETEKEEPKQPQGKEQTADSEPYAKQYDPENIIEVYDNMKQTGGTKQLPQHKQTEPTEETSFKKKSIMRSEKKINYDSLLNDTGTNKFKSFVKDISPTNKNMPKEHIDRQTKFKI